MHENEDHVVFGNRSFIFSIITKNEIENIQDPEHAYLDYEKLDFPLKLRNWNHGDSFIPFGFEHNKKLSDFFIRFEIVTL